MGRGNFYKHLKNYRGYFAFLIWIKISSLYYNQIQSIINAKVVNNISVNIKAI